MRTTFRGGVHPLHASHEGKAPTRGQAIIDYVADTVTIMMGMHLGAPSTPTVQARNAMYPGERNSRCDASFENAPDVV